MMRVYRYGFQPGETRSINAVGRFIRGLAAKARYQIQFDDGPATEFETGIAYEAVEPFQQVRITNTADIEQIIEVAIADGFVDDNRLVGRLDVEGLIETQINGGVDVNNMPPVVVQSLPAAVSAIVHPVQTISAATEVLGVNAQRRSAVIQCSNDVYVGNAVDGVMLRVFTWEAQSALTLVPSSGAVDVKILEEVNA